MAYQAPPNFAAGAVLTEAQLDTLSDDISFLANKPRVRVYNSAAISIPHDTATALTFNSERFDTDTMHSTAVNTGRITFTTAGTYLVGATLQFADNATGNRQVAIRLNGSTLLDVRTFPAYSTGGGSMLGTATLYAFSAGDYVEVRVYQNSGAALDVVASGNHSPEFWAILQAVA